MKNIKNTIAILLLIFTFSCSKNDEPATPVPNPEPTTTDLNYVNGTLSTGATTTDGTVAPNGYTWSQTEPTNEVFGFLSGNLYHTADDFIVPTGQKWTINKIVFYAYQTGHVLESSPINEMYYEIYSSNPSAVGSQKIYGDFSTNKYVAAIDSKICRVYHNIVDTKRIIFKITSSATDLVLSPGTYWIKWKSKAVNNQNIFFPGNTNKGFATKPEYNALNFDVTANTWAILNNGANNKVDFPFELIGTKTKI